MWEIIEERESKNAGRREATITNGMWLLTQMCIRRAMICEAALHWGTLASLFYAVIYCPALALTIYHTELAVTDENDLLEKLSHLSLSQPVN